MPFSPPHTEAYLGAPSGQMMLLCKANGTSSSCQRAAPCQATRLGKRVLWAGFHFCWLTRVLYIKYPTLWGNTVTSPGYTAWVDGGLLIRLCPTLGLRGCCCGGHAAVWMQESRSQATKLASHVAKRKIKRQGSTLWEELQVAWQRTWIQGQWSSLLWRGQIVCQRLTGC